MNKIKSEYEVLKFLSKQSEWFFTEDIAIKMRTAETCVLPTISSLMSQELIAMKHQYKTNTLLCPTYKITGKGVERFRGIRKENFDRAITLIGLIVTVASALAAFLA